MSRGPPGRTRGRCTRARNGYRDELDVEAAIDVRFRTREGRHRGTSRLDPDGAAFVGGDLSGLGEILARNAREDRAVVLVYPDGEEWVVEPHRPAKASEA